jgi:acid phosphatase
MLRTAIRNRPLGERSATRPVLNAVGAAAGVVWLTVCSAAARGTPPTPATPIEHLIVVVGENQSFDSVFATYTPPPGESVRNLLSEGIIRPDGTPGEHYGRAAQVRAVAQSHYTLDPPRAGRYEYLPRPTLIGVLSWELRPVGNGPDLRFPQDLPPGPFQITRYVVWPRSGAGAGLATAVAHLGAATGDPVHRFFQMWQQTGGDNARPDLYAWVAVTTGMGGDTLGVTRAYPGQGGEEMGFVNIAAGDAPVFRDLARRYAMSDNYHQPIMGGTGANFFAIATADVAFFNVNGEPAVPPANQIENPDRAPGSANYYRRDGYQGGSYVECAEPHQPGVAPILALLGRRGLASRCEPGHYYLVNNYAPGYDLDGHPQPIAPHNYNYPPQTVRTIAEALTARGVSWGWYTGGRDSADLEEERLSGNVSLATARRAQYNYLGDPLVASRAVMSNPGLRSHLQGLASFTAELHAGTLPAVAFVVPKILSSGHPGDSVLTSYEDFLADIVAQVKSRPAIWAHTAIIATTDEGGGHFDSGYIQTLDFFGDGPRIPLLVISPYARPGHIDHVYNDHVSILKFIERNWGLAPLTRRSRDQLPDPITRPGDPYRPVNEPAIGDLMTLFDFGSPPAHLTPLARLGKALFYDESLSSSGRLACASCHDPARAYGPPPGAGPVMVGGTHMDRPGLRAVPSLRYRQDTPRFTRHLYVALSDDAEDAGPGGGLMWDGRSDALEAQALLPLLDPREMANGDVRELAARLRAGPEAARLHALGGASAWRDDRRTAVLAARALARFQLEDPSFHPYDSRYDDYLRGKGSMTAQELRGLKLFNSADKGNCAECHPSAPGPGGHPPDFTDYRFAALGVPRNPAIPANENASFYDLGLCGPLRTDLNRESAEYCGLFQTPTLRNVARRSYFFHNGRFTTLDQVLRFYVERDLDPGRWYPRSAGHAELYDDLPAAYRDNVDRSDPPFDRRPGQAPALTDAEIADVIAFLETLSDRS